MWKDGMRRYSVNVIGPYVPPNSIPTRLADGRVSAYVKSDKRLSLRQWQARLPGFEIRDPIPPRKKEPVDKLARALELMADKKVGEAVALMPGNQLIVRSALKSTLQAQPANPKAHYDKLIKRSMIKGAIRSSLDYIKHKSGPPPTRALMVAAVEAPEIDPKFIPAIRRNQAALLTANQQESREREQREFKMVWDSLIRPAPGPA